MTEGATTRRDTPAQYLVAALVAATAAGAIGFASRPDIADPRDLRQVAGRVEDISLSGGGRIPVKIQILVRDGMRIHRLVQDDPGDAVPAVRTIRVGDSIVAMMQPDVLGPDLERVWSLTRGSEQLVSYRETLQILLSKAKRARLVAFAIGTMGLLLLSYAFALRIRRGAWYHASENR